MFLCTTLLAFEFIACSDDDNDDNDNKSVFRVDKINIIDHMDPPEEITENFVYDNEGRVIRVNYAEGYGINYTYEENKLTVSYIPIESETYFMLLDDKGYVSEYEEDKYIYDAREHLIQIKENDEIVISITWKDDNITEIVREDGSKNIYTYTSYDNKANIDLSSYLGLQVGVGHLPGVYGKMNKKLLATQTYSEDGMVDRYEYTFNEQGAVTKVLVYENEILYRTYTIEYVK